MSCCRQRLYSWSDSDATGNSATCARTPRLIWRAIPAPTMRWHTEDLRTCIAMARVVSSECGATSARIRVARSWGISTSRCRLMALQIYCTQSLKSKTSSGEGTMPCISAVRAWWCFSRAAVHVGPPSPVRTWWMCSWRGSQRRFKKCTSVYVASPQVELAGASRPGTACANMCLRAGAWKPSSRMSPGRVRVIQVAV